MDNVIQFPGIQIDVGKLEENVYKLQAGLIAPPEEDCTYDVLPNHTSEPIKSLDDINRISDYLIAKSRWRDNMLFIVGINFGLRVSDLISLRFSHIINENLTFKDSFGILEKKTKNTRRVKKNRYITINKAVIEAVTVYLQHVSGAKLSDYMFRSESAKDGGANVPLRRESVDRIIKQIAKDVDLNVKVSTHTLRKTWAYHQMVMSGNDPRKLLLIQKAFGHSTSAQTLDYIGITSEEISEAYRKLNLGNKKFNYLVDSKLIEKTFYIA